MTDAVAVTVVTVVGGVMTTFLRLIFRRLGQVRDKQERDTEHLAAKIDAVHTSVATVPGSNTPGQPMKSARPGDVPIRDRTPRRNL